MKTLSICCILLLSPAAFAKLIIADTIGQEKIVRTLAMSLAKDRSVEIKSAKLTDALRKLRQGKVNLVLSNYKLGTKQRRTLQVNCYRYALEPVLFITGAGNKTDNISSKNLKKVLRGDIATWAPLGGEAFVINLAIVKDDQPGMQALYKEFMKKSGIKARHLVVSSAKGISVLASIKEGFFGVCGYISLPLPAKPLSVDGVAPTLENIRSGKYRPVAEYWIWISSREDLKKTIEYKSALEFLQLLRRPETIRLIESCGLLSSAKEN